MVRRHSLTASLAFNAGVLVTLACSQGGDAVNAVAETVAAGVRAIDVAFDDSVAQLATTTAQGAIDAMDTRVDSLDSTVDELNERLTAAEGATAALTTRLNGVDAAKLQAALDALSAKNAELQITLDAHQALLADYGERLTSMAATDASLSSCPPETYRVGTTCIEVNPREETFFDSAAMVCGKLGGRLCFPSEFSASCELKDAVYTLGKDEFTAILAQTGPRLVNTDFNFCNTYNDPVQTPDDPGVYPFRCCYDRINLAGPPPAPTP